MAKVVKEAYSRFRCKLTQGVKLMGEAGACRKNVPAGCR